MVEIEKNKILVTCSKGLSPFLAEEIRLLDFPVHEEKTLGVFTEGSLEDTIKLNLHIRTGQRVLYFLKDFGARSAEDLYNNVVQIPWENYLEKDGYFSITSAIMNDSISDSRFANMKCKDAIADRMRQVYDIRPDSGVNRTKSVYYLYWKDDECSIFLDTSGEPLSRRGYRKIPFKAPMQETLAAAVILASKWKNGEDFINPMCGSGTLAIEAALIGLNKAPGLLRNNFGFMHIKNFNRKAYKLSRLSAKTATKKKLDSNIIATDIDPQAVQATLSNAKTAGVDQFIETGVCDFAKTPVPDRPGVIVLNPEYGMRLGEIKALEDTYQQIGDFFKQECSGYRGYIFTGNLKLAKRVGLKTKHRTIFYNSQIECRLLEYELYSGTKKLKYKNQPSANLDS